MEQPFTFQIQLTDPYTDALERVTQALKTEGFGVLTNIDVKDTFKQKLDEEFRQYMILGACNPQLANKALQSEPLVGLLLPCTVTVEENPQGSLVSIINPEAMLGMQPLSDNTDVAAVAKEARQRLERVAALLKDD